MEKSLFSSVVLSVNFSDNSLLGLVRDLNLGPLMEGGYSTHSTRLAQPNVCTVSCCYNMDLHVCTLNINASALLLIQALIVLIRCVQVMIFTSPSHILHYNLMHLFKIHGNLHFRGIKKVTHWNIMVCLLFIDRHLYVNRYTFIDILRSQILCIDTVWR